jgi:hypothetical protein
MYLKPLHLPKPSILVLEDDSALRAGLCRLLNAAGYVLTEGGTGTSRAGRIDLVLAGIGARPTPKAALHLLDRAVPAILLVDRAAWAGFDFFDAANELGAVAALQRPCSRSVLLRLVAKVLADSMRGARPAEDADPHPAQADVLVQLENPNFA